MITNEYIKDGQTNIKRINTKIRTASLITSGLREADTKMGLDGKKVLRESGCEV